MGPPTKVTTVQLTYWRSIWVTTELTCFYKIFSVTQFFYKGSIEYNTCIFDKRLAHIMIDILNVRAMQHMETIFLIHHVTKIPDPYP